MNRLPRRHVLLPILLVFFAIGGISCRGTRSGSPEKTYTFVFLVTGPNQGSKTPEEQQTIMAGHMANIGRLADEDKLLIAGPFAQPKPDEKLRGIFILDTADTVTARAWVDTDPGVQAGVFSAELVPFRSAAPLRRSLEAYRAEKGELEKSGKQPEMSEMVRSYAMVLTHDRGRVERALQVAHAKSRMIFDGELEGSPRGSYFGVLDAKDVGEATRFLQASNVDERDLVGWFSAKSVTAISK